MPYFIKGHFVMVTLNLTLSSLQHFFFEHFFYLYNNSKNTALWYTFKTVLAGT